MCKPASSRVAAAKERRIPHWLKFCGTIGRVRFLATLSAFILSSMGTAAALKAVSSAALNLPLLWTALIVGLVLVATLFWALAAAVTQRLRDAGLPIWIFPALFFLCIADSVLADITGWRALWPDVHTTPIGSIAVLAFWLTLLLWPGPDADGRRRLAPPGRLGPILASVVVLTAMAGAALVVDPYQKGGCGSEQRSAQADCARFGIAGRAYAAILLFRANKAIDRESPLDALPLLERALALRPNNAFALNSRGLAHAALGDHGAAQADYAQALSVAPGYIKARGNRAYSHLVLGEFAEADADFAAIRAADPATPGYAELLRYIDQVQAARMRR